MAQDTEQLEHLAENPDIDAVLQAHPEFTRDDVQAALARAREQLASRPGFVSPQQFYREATQREDIRRILDALAK